MSKIGGRLRDLKKLLVHDVTKVDVNNSERTNREIKTFLKKYDQYFTSLTHNDEVMLKVLFCLH
jgi:hypothetical protein